MELNRRRATFNAHLMVIFFHLFIVCCVLAACIGGHREQMGHMCATNIGRANNWCNTAGGEPSTAIRCRLRQTNGGTEVSIVYNLPSTSSSPINK